MKTVLVVHENSELCEDIAATLQDTYNVCVATTSEEGLRHFRNKRIHMILMGSRLRDIPSDRLLEMIRDESGIPIIVLPDVEDLQSTAALLSVGANDYLGQPFDADTLLSRIERQIDIGPAPVEPSGLLFKNLKYYPQEANIEVLGHPVELSRKEIEIMRLLMRQPYRTISKEYLYSEIWGDGLTLDENTVNVHICSLRKKLRKVDPNVNYIETVWGVGVRLATVD